MTEATVLQLVEAHGVTPKDPIYHLVDLYKEKCQLGSITMGEREAIGEYYRVIENRGLPAYQWMSEVFCVIGKKEKQKRNIRYAIGIIRSWLKFGFGHIPSQEERDVLEFFEEVIGQEASPEAVHKIQQLMGEHGVVKVTRLIAKLEHDRSLFIILGIESILNS